MSDTTTAPTVVSGFVSPLGHDWENYPIIVLSDGSWKVWAVSKWTDYLPPVVDSGGADEATGEIK